MEEVLFVRSWKDHEQFRHPQGLFLKTNSHRLLLSPHILRIGCQQHIAANVTQRSFNDLYVALEVYASSICAKK
eukprot:6356679-Karenia_brevis.AAC.1